MIIIIIRFGICCKSAVNTKAAWCPFTDSDCLRPQKAGWTVLILHLLLPLFSWLGINHWVKMGHAILKRGWQGCWEIALFFMKISDLMNFSFFQTLILMLQVMKLHLNEDFGVSVGVRQLRMCIMGFSHHNWCTVIIIWLINNHY